MSIFFIYNQSPLNSFSINDCSSAEDKISVALPTVPPCLSQTVYDLCQIFLILLVVVILNVIV